MGADSVIDLNGKLISKPNNRDEALTILKKTPLARQAIVLQSQIVQFILNKKQVKKECYRNKLNSPVQNFILSDETPTTPVILSLDDANLNEINLVLPNQEETDNSIVRYFSWICYEIFGVE